MNTLDQFFQSDIVHALGWTILHSFWQGLLIVILLTIGLVVLRRHSSRLRYLAGYLALLSLALCSAGTFYLHLPAATGEPAVSIENAPPAYDMTEAVAAVSPPSVTTPVLSEVTYWQQFVRFLESNLPWITIVWMIGVLILSLRFLAELAYIQRLKYQPGGMPAKAFQEQLNQLAAKMGVRKFVELKENIRINSPMVIGFIKPVILVPFGLLSNLDPRQVESILAHELAHIRRHDYLFNLLQSLVEIVLFFNPATWWISSLIRNEREHSCDEMAIAATGNQLAFVQTLAKLEEYRATPNRMALAFNGRGESGVLGRIKRILNSEEQFRIPYRLFWSCLILLGSLGLFAFQAQPLPEQDHAAFSKPLIDDPEMESVDSSHSLATPETVEKKQPSDANEVNPPAREKSPEPEEISSTTKENLNEHPPAEETSFGEQDTVPEKVKQLRQQMRQLAKDFQEKEMVFQKQSRDIQKKKMQLERELQQIENDQTKQIFELEKKSQEIQLNQNVKSKELELEYSTIENKMMDLQYKIAQLEEKMRAEGKTEEIRKQHSEHRQQALDLEKRKREIQLNQKRNQFEMEKLMQQLQNQQWQLKEEIQIKQNEKRLEIMELEQMLQEIKFQNQVIQSENQNKMQLLQMQIQEEMEQWQERQ